MGEVRAEETILWSHQLAALEADQAILFAQQKGTIQRTILPLPEKLPGVMDMMEQARRDIDKT
jgi:hypothetical protein